MSITIGSTTFDRVDYDAKADVLYLHVGDPAQAVNFDESPKGHAVRFDVDGKLVGITLVNAKGLLDQGAPSRSRSRNKLRSTQRSWRPQFSPPRRAGLVSVQESLW